MNNQLTYQELLDFLKTLAPEQLKDNVTIFDNTISEFIPVSNTAVATEDDVLHKGHVYLEIQS